MTIPLDKVFTPPARIGILGGGQLGAMLCEAGRRMGYEMAVLSESEEDPGATWANRHVVGDTHDPETVEDFARGLHVLTNEFEQVPPEVLAAAEKLGTCRVAPAAAVQSICRDRRHEKNLFAKFNFPHGPFGVAESASQMLAVYQHLATDLELPVVAKTARGGYDGKGQKWLRSELDAEAAWTDLGQVPLMLEQAVNFTAEASVIVARSPNGARASFPMFKNEHRGGILFQTIAPAGFSPETEKQARDIAEAIADRVGVVGLLAVEMFVLDNGHVLVNELAARPHNSGHLTLRATTRSQFELHIAAICNLPLGEGAVRLLRPAVMTNLLGDLWGPDGDVEPHWPALFKEPRGTLHLYGKKAARPGRKMGHMIHLGETRAAALEAATGVFEKLRG